LRSGGHLRNRRDTGGHAVRTVRDREAPGFKSRAPDQFLNSEFVVGIVRGGDIGPGDHSEITDSPKPCLENLIGRRCLQDPLQVCRDDRRIAASH
jgi:hypothetical protein